MITEFCPYCWQTLGGGNERCPHCGFRLDDYNQLSFRDKLTLSLMHPVRENRMMAIQLLGDLRDPHAISALQSLVDGESDFFVIREVINSLVKINTPESRDLLQSLSRHSARLIKESARDALRELNRTKRDDS